MAAQDSCFPALVSNTCCSIPGINLSPALVFPGEAVLPVGEAGHELHRAAEVALLRHLPRRRHHLRRLVPTQSYFLASSLDGAE